MTKRTRDFRTLRSNILAKTKKFVKLFLSVFKGPRSNLLRRKKCQKSRDTAVPLRSSLKTTNVKCNHTLMKEKKQSWNETVFSQIDQFLKFT